MGVSDFFFVGGGFNKDPTGYYMRESPTFGNAHIPKFAQRSKYADSRVSRSQNHSEYGF